MTTDSTRRIESLGGTGILRQDDIRALNAGCRAVLAILADGKPHSGPELQDRLDGQREILRRLRELRAVYEIRCWRGKGRSHWYQLVGRAAPAPRTSAWPCPHCQGTGTMKATETPTPDVQGALFDLPRGEWD